MPNRNRKNSPSGLTGVLYQQAGFWLLGFFSLVLLAFWTSYYGVLAKSMPAAIHLHGITMTVWCLMLIAQAFLVRIRQLWVHKTLGTLSYVVAPLVVITGAHLAHQTVLNAAARPDLYYHLIALMFNSLIVFFLFYGLAMYNRKKPMTHARYMISTVFPLVTPVTDRIIHKYINELVPHLPTIGGAPIAPIAGYLLTDMLVLGLLIRDWRTHKRLDVFPVVLAVLILYHISAMTFYKLGFWRQIGDWIMALPLS